MVEQTIININNYNPNISLMPEMRIGGTCKTDNTQGLELDEITCHHGLQQIINSPTHILPNSASSIDLIFTSQRNLIIDSGPLYSQKFVK